MRKRNDDAEKIEAELRELYEQLGGLDPSTLVEWARENPDSALHARLNWDDTEAAHAYRVWQMRQIITEVEVVYPDGKRRQVFVSPIESRGNGGYASLVDVMSDAERRARYLSQALAEYRRLGEKYEDLVELAEVREAVARVPLTFEQDQTHPD